MNRELPPDPNVSAGPRTAAPDTVARRRFVRGVFAAPAVMTICTGSAYAAAVSATCLVKAQNLPEPVVDAFSAGDIWIRVPVFKFPAPDNRLYVRYGDPFNENKGLTSIGRGPIPPVPSLNSNDFIELDITAGTLMPQSTLIAPSPAPVPNGSFVVVRLDGSGYVVGTGRGGKPGALTSVLCWTSLTPFR